MFVAFLTHLSSYMSARAGSGVQMIFSAALTTVCRVFFVCSRLADEPNSNAVCQNAFCCSSIECCHDLRRGLGLSQSLQEVKVLLGFLR